MIYFNKPKILFGIIGNPRFEKCKIFMVFSLIYYEKEGEQVETSHLENGWNMNHMFHSFKIITCIVLSAGNNEKQMGQMPLRFLNP